MKSRQRGEVYLDGALINRLKPYERNISTVLQNYALFPHLTVKKNVEFGLRHRNSAGVGVRPEATRISREAPTEGTRFLSATALPLYAGLERIDPGLLEAAADLGVSPWQTMTRVLVPLSAPGIRAGAVLVFIPDFRL